MSDSNTYADTLVITDDVTLKIINFLFAKYKIDFNDYKPATIKRRIERRAAALGLDDTAKYLEFLHQNHGEIEILYKDLLISVTFFFRDKEAFDTLNTHVIPELLKTSQANKQEIRVWVPACSTGEEVYSIAMLLAEAADKSCVYLEAKIFATDVNSESLEIASEGIYNSEATANIPQQYLRKYFHKKGEEFQIIKKIRSMVVFAPYNVISDPPFTRMDLISCRNFLIYITPDAQKRVINSLRFGLKNGGYLLLGPSESAGDKLADLERVSTKWKLYKKTRQYRPVQLRTSASKSKKVIQTGALSIKTDSLFDKPQPFPLYAYHEIIKKIVPLGFILDENRKVVHTFGNTSKLLHLPEGAIDTDILGMIQSDLKVPLNTGLYRARKNNETVRYANVCSDTTQEHYDLIVSPIRNALEKTTYYLVHFEKSDEQNTSEQEKNKRSFNFDLHAQQVIKELEGELRESRELLQATMEEIEATNEELQSTNEELLASNEELQSTNEELHSANVELSSINHEYQKKLDELTLLDNDVDNLLRSIDIGTIFVDENKALKLFTPASQRYFNILSTDIGRPITHFSHDLLDFDISQIFKLVKKSKILYETEVKTRVGLWLLLRATPSVSIEGNFTGVIYSFTDITSLKQAEKSLEQLAHFDNLTALPNRASFMAALPKAVEHAKQSKAKLCVFFIDLDNFKQINDCLGHGAGDELLKLVSHKMQTSVKPVDYIARIGGDEFGVILKSKTNPTEIASIAESFINAFKEPLHISGREVKTSLSIGIALYPSGGKTSDELIRHADMAMYRAKEKGKDAYFFFNDEINQQVTKAHLLENSLRHAIDHNELSIMFQPQFNSIEHKLIGFEALARWNSKKIGAISPQEFIRTAESSKLIISIGEWVINAACEAFSKFSKLAPNPDTLVLAINISAKQLMVSDLPLYIKTTLEKHKIKPTQLVLEITESSLMYRSKVSEDIVKQLHHTGIRFALDDFGVRYSSLHYLKDLPVATLKIDQGFVKNITSNRSDEAIVQSVISLAKGLDMDVIAEGVENHEQMQCLKRNNCHLMQGFLLGKPLTAEQASQLLIHKKAQEQDQQKKTNKKEQVEASSE